MKYKFRSDLKYKEPVTINISHQKHMMCLNESSLNPFQEIRDALLQRLQSIPLNRYFNPVTAEMKKKLADYCNVQEDYLSWGNGADEMLYYIFISVRENNSSHAVSLSPSYFDYKSYCDAVGLQIQFLSLDPKFDFIPAQFLALTKTAKCRLIIICNPNNPTGNLFSMDKIKEVIENSECPVIIDETYYEFSGCTLADQLDRYRNLIIVRSFSKAFSVAGLRFGYIISHPDNIKELNKVMTIFHLNLLTQSFICAILDNKEVFLEHNHRVISLRNKLFDDLSCIEGIQVHPSHTNFLIFSLGKKTGEYYEFMIQNEVSLRPVWSHPLLHDYLRVSISSESANNIFLEKTREYARQNEWTIVDQ